MPHVFKRVVNSLENSNPSNPLSRTCIIISITHKHLEIAALIVVSLDNGHKRGVRKHYQTASGTRVCQPCNLKMIEDVFNYFTADVGALKFSKLTRNHFIKDAWSRMRVNLALQVCVVGAS